MIQRYEMNKRREIIARRGKSAQHIATVAATRHLMKIVSTRCVMGTPDA